MPASRKVLPWILILAALVIVAALIHRIRSTPNESVSTARPGPSETSAIPTRPVSAPVDSNPPKPPQAQTDLNTTAAPEAQKPETPFVLGSAEAPPAMDPSTATL